MVLLMVTSISLSGCGNSEEPSPGESVDQSQESDYKGIIVALGDSLTAGYGLDEHQAYPAKLEQKLAKQKYRYKVVNAGVSGETSSGTLSRIPWVVRTLQPDIVILETGANDGLRGIDPSVTRENIGKIITMLKADGIVVVLAGMKLPPNLGITHTEAFASLYGNLAKTHNVILIPFFLDNVAGVQRLNLPDGLHPTEKGYDKVMENVYPHIVKAIKTIE